MIGIIFNHDMRDDPYNQKASKGGANKLCNIIEALGEKLYMSVGTERNVFLEDKSDEYVVVHHTCELTKESKKEIADAICEMLTLKKSFGTDVEKVIVFEKKSSDDIFEY